MFLTLLRDYITNIKPCTHTHTYVYIFECSCCNNYVGLWSIHSDEMNVNISFREIHDNLIEEAARLT
jgi:hypothetical protein